MSIERRAANEGRHGGRTLETWSEQVAPGPRMIAANRTGGDRTRPQAALPELDEETLDELLHDLGGDLVPLGRVIDTFLAHLSIRLARIRHAVVSGEREAIVRAAQELRSASTTLGGMRLAAACRALQRGAGGCSDVEGDLADLVPPIRSAATSISVTLRRYLTSGSAAEG